MSRVAFIVKPFQVELLGIAYLAAVLKNKGHDCLLIRTDKDMSNDLTTFNPQVLAYSSTTGQHNYYLKLNREIKKWGILSIIGGAHPTYFPEVLREEGIDGIVRGESEDSILYVLGHLEAGKKTNIPPWPLIQDLDTIPYPDREFLYRYEDNKNNPIKNVMTSRGCPFSCPYCFNSLYRAMYPGQKWTRFRTIGNVLGECIQLKERYPLKLIFFQDDEFLSNPNLFKLLDMYKKIVKVPFHCQLRIELLTEEKVARLKEAGCYSVTFAIESGNAVIRTRLLQRNMSTEKILEGAELLRKYKIKFRTENMIGLPGETLKQVLETVLLNQMVKPTIGWCSIFQPYPNLPLAKYAMLKGYWDGKLNMKESFFEETILKTTEKREIENLQKLFSLAVHFRIPSMILRRLLRLPKNSVYNFIYKYIKAWRYEDLYGKGEL